MKGWKLFALGALFGLEGIKAWYKALANIKVLC